MMKLKFAKVFILVAMFILFQIPNVRICFWNFMFFTISRVIGLPFIPKKELGNGIMIQTMGAMDFWLAGRRLVAFYYIIVK